MENKINYWTLVLHNGSLLMVIHVNSVGEGRRCKFQRWLSIDEGWLDSIILLHIRANADYCSERFLTL